MDRHHIIHLFGVLPGWYLSVTVFLLVVLLVIVLCCIIFFSFFFVLADPTLWHHVIGFSRSLLLDESNPGLQPRCLLIFNWFQKNFAFCVLCDFAKEK